MRFIDDFVVDPSERSLPMIRVWNTVRTYLHGVSFTRAPNSVESFTPRASATWVVVVKWLFFFFLIFFPFFSASTANGKFSFSSIHYTLPIRCSAIAGRSFHHNTHEFIPSAGTALLRMRSYGIKIICIIHPRCIYPCFHVFPHRSSSYTANRTPSINIIITRYTKL